MIEPMLKWAGGKRWLTAYHEWLFPKDYTRHIEPFLGGAAVFLWLNPKNAILSDLNSELIATYKAIQSDPSAVQAALKRYAAQHSDAFYYDARSKPEECPHAEAARFLYLNRTCWNGLYRVNLRGQFNVPRGTKNKVLLETDDFTSFSERLSRAEISTGDFETTLDKAGKGDFVFLDPPYTVAHNNNGFVKYNENIFAWKDQVRLKNAAEKAAQRGAMVLITNAKHSSLEELYSGVGTHHVVRRHSVISGSADFRKKIEELIVQIGYSTSAPIVAVQESGSGERARIAS